MEFLVSYKVTKRNDVNHIEYNNVVDRNVLDKWSFEICNTERFIDGYEYTILNCSILSFYKLGPY